MRNHIFSHIFLFFAMVGVTAGEYKGSVTFSGMQVIVECHEGARVKIDKRGINETTFTEKYLDSNHDVYSCAAADSTDSADPTYKFYIKAKVCENCYELDGSYVAAAICADLLITGGIILLVYAYGQRKSGPAPPKPTNARNPTGSGGPPVPNPDYQQLSDFTRSKDTYATVHKTHG
ncbi:T-cell surface glycoprotein CD3 epsilon chain-like [Sardina pilchardus]|uniref:T-cell surface glycoprotein CD3 epsilon chain-like n=1 Tax=Sardina pilchardus TaxID=27697 RepID=UPI002E10B51F